jgi:hypothetical protein
MFQAETNPTPDPDPLLFLASGIKVETAKVRNPTRTGAEACTYLNTASLTISMDNDWSHVYLNITGKTYKRLRKGEMHDDIWVDSFNDQQTADLKSLRMALKSTNNG